MSEVTDLIFFFTGEGSPWCLDCIRYLLHSCMGLDTPEGLPKP